mgnify:CR=1 FL=1
MRGNSHVRCGMGEKAEIISKPYLSLIIGSPALYGADRLSVAGSVGGRSQLCKLIDMIGSMQTREDNEDFRNPIDLMFEDLEREKPDCFAVRQYKKFKLAAGDICSK